MALIIDDPDLSDWFIYILPEIRKVYRGKVVFVEIPYGKQWETIEKESPFFGYDCVGITIFPWKEYAGINDLRSYQDLREFVDARARTLNELGEKYDIDCRIAATLGMDHWYGEMSEPDIRAKGYAIALDILKEHQITGVFLHIWASEQDHLGDSTEVENMLGGRWTEVE